MSLFGRLLLVTGPLLVLALVVAGTAIDQATERREVERTRTTVTFLLADLRTTLETNYHVGINLGQLRLAQDLIERKATQNQKILAIEIFDAGGVTRFSTDRGLIGEVVPDIWRDAIIEQQDAEVWTADDAGGLLFGMPVRDDLGAVVGHVTVLVAAAEEGMVDRLADVAAVPALVWVLPLAMSAMVIAIATLIRRSTRDVLTAATVLDVPSQYAGGRDQPALAAMAATARVAAEAANAELEAAIAAVIRLDSAVGAPTDDG